ncbi:MAG: signal peptidase II [Chloroflexi bacterium]|nr:signal peptidase II [Chloroflexota bacterium]
MSEESTINEEAKGPVSKPAKKLWYKDGWLLTIALTTLVLDQFTKFIIQSSFYEGQSLPREGFFRITYTTNTGSAFGLFPNQTLFLVVASFIGIAFLIFFYRSHPLRGNLIKLSLGLQLGGAIGNLLDRVRLGMVIDFIDVGIWPVFNLADSAIVVGIGILAWIILSSKEEWRAAGKREEVGLQSDQKDSSP